MSQHNIIGSEAFEGKRYIIVRSVRGGIGRHRRRRSLLMAIAVAVVALVIGAMVAVFALSPLWMAPVPSTLPAAAASEAGAQTPLGLQPVDQTANRPAS